MGFGTRVLLWLIERSKKVKHLVFVVCVLAVCVAPIGAAAETWVADDWRLPETPTVETATAVADVGVEDCCLRRWIVAREVPVPYYATPVRAVPRCLRPWWLRGPVRRALSWPFRLRVW